MSSQDDARANELSQRYGNLNPWQDAVADVATLPSNAGDPAQATVDQSGQQSFDPSTAAAGASALVARWRGSSVMSVALGLLGKERGPPRCAHTQFFRPHEAGFCTR